MELLKKILFFDVFPLICRLVAVFFMLLAIYGIGIPPSGDIGSAQLTLLVLSVVFFLVPVAKKISLGQFFTFEREIEKVKEDVAEFKAETRQFLNVYSNMITAISNTVSQTVNVHLPGQAEAQEAKEELNPLLVNKRISSALVTRLSSTSANRGTILILLLLDCVWIWSGNYGKSLEKEL